jgi:hypothetical protein
MIKVRSLGLFREPEDRGHRTENRRYLVNKATEGCGSQGANFTAGVREREDASRTREAGDSVLVKTEFRSRLVGADLHLRDYRSEKTNPKLRSEAERP